MASLIPAAEMVLADRRLRGAPRELYFWLYRRLDVLAYRHVTLGQMAHGTGLGRSTVATARHTLETHGFLERRRVGGQRMEYRLVHSPPATTRGEAANERRDGNG